MTSIRFYLIAALLSAVALGNFIALVYGYRASLNETQSLLDSQLNDTSTIIGLMLPSDQSVVGAPSSRLAYQIWSSNKELVQQSANAGSRPMTEFIEGYRDGNFEGHRWRMLSRWDAAEKRWILVGERMDIRTELADNLVLNAVVPIVLVLPMIALIVWLVVGHGLAPLKKLARELRSRQADDLATLQIAKPPEELMPVVEAINDLLRRLQEAVSRERRFSADAAHELRTPLSAIKVHVHNLRQEFPNNEEAFDVLDRDVSRFSHLIEQILQLYRMTPESYQSNMQEVDLYALAQSVIGDLYTEIDSRNQTISLEGLAADVTGDRASLVILLSNLILNASKYSPEGASIAVGVDRMEHEVCLKVEDTGPGIPVDEVDRLFDRFYRVGGDRHNSSVEGCGLGLSIVKHISDLHRAKIVIENSQNHSGLIVKVLLPTRHRVSTTTERLSR